MRNGVITAVVLLICVVMVCVPLPLSGSTQAVSYSDDCIYGANKENLGNDPYTICEGCRTLISRHLRGASE